MIYGGHFDVSNKEQEINRLEQITLKSDFWNDKEEATRIIDEMNALKEIVSKIKDVKKEIDNNLEIIDLLVLEPDEELKQNVNDNVKVLEKKINELSIFLLLSGPYDSHNCLLEIHAGAGGTEACDWADMLFRMYLRYFDRHHFKYNILS